MGLAGRAVDGGYGFVWDRVWSMFPCGRGGAVRRYVIWWQEGDCPLYWGDSTVQFGSSYVTPTIASLPTPKPQVAGKLSLCRLLSVTGVLSRKDGLTGT